eukprot:2960227-Prymnesium_polylepis.1
MALRQASWATPAQGTEAPRSRPMSTRPRCRRAACARRESRARISLSTRSAPSCSPRRPRHCFRNVVRWPRTTLSSRSWPTRPAACSAAGPEARSTCGRSPASKDAVVGRTRTSDAGPRRETVRSPPVHTARRFESQFETCKLKIYLCKQSTKDGEFWWFMFEDLTDKASGTAKSNKCEQGSLWKEYGSDKNLGGGW